MLVGSTSLFFFFILHADSVRAKEGVGIKKTGIKRVNILIRSLLKEEKKRKKESERKKNYGNENDDQNEILFGFLFSHNCKLNLNEDIRAYANGIKMCASGSEKEHEGKQQLSLTKRKKTLVINLLRQTKWTQQK